MKTGFRILALVALVTALHCSNAAACDVLRLEKLFSESTVKGKLDAIPELRDMVMQMMHDSAIPANIRRILAKTLQNPETTVMELTTQVRREFGIPDNAIGLHVIRTPKWRFIKKSDSRETTGGRDVNEIASNSLNRDNSYPSERVVFVQNRRMTSEANDLMTLIHELAHIRFTTLLEKHLPKLADRLPDNVLRKTADNKYEINRQFLTLLNERYAHEVEFHVLKSSIGRYFKERYQYPEMLDKLQTSYANQWIADNVAGRYKITDPIVQPYRKMSISEALLGRGQ